MKKIISIIIIILFLFQLSFAKQFKSKGYLYCEITKQVNGNYTYGLPILELNILQKPFIVDIEFKNNFTSKRGYIQIPNHHSSQVEFHFGVNYNQFWTTFSLGGIYYYAENDDNIPEGLSFRNTFRIGVEIK